MTTQHVSPGQSAGRNPSQRSDITKRRINTQRIYPPLNGDPDAIRAAAAPVLQDQRTAG